MFSGGKTKATGSTPARPTSRNGAAGLSFIGPDVLVSGDITTNGQIHIDGRIDGNVRCDNLVQGESGTIAGNIVADDARIAGLVDGTVTGRIVTLEPTAKVTGDVAYETLSIAPGASIDGRLSRRQAGAGDAIANLLTATDKADQPVESPLPALAKPSAAMV